MRTLILLLALIIVSCQDKGKKEVDSKFSKILREMQDELDRLGQWDYSPDGGCKGLVMILYLWIVY